MILARLKQETAIQHQQLEHRLGLPASITSRTAYTRLLADFLGVYQPLESLLFEHDAWRTFDPHWQTRRKVPMLLADLQDLGMSKHDIRDLPRCSHVPTITMFADVLGSMYVLEGATLGGQIISRHLQPLLALAPDRGCRFFSSYGANLGAKWREFGQLVRKHAHDDAAEAAMIHSACMTFETFDCWFAQQGYGHD